MIAAAVPPRRCHNCNTTWATRVDKREYRSLPCCQQCDHDDGPRVCNGCAADHLVCARKSSMGGRPCCEGCSHVHVRKAKRWGQRSTAQPNRTRRPRTVTRTTHHGDEDA